MFVCFFLILWSLFFFGVFFSFFSFFSFFFFFSFRLVFLGFFVVFGLCGFLFALLCPSASDPKSDRGSLFLLLFFFAFLFSYSFIIFFYFSSIFFYFFLSFSFLLLDLFFFFFFFSPVPFFFFFFFLSPLFLTSLSFPLVFILSSIFLFFETHPFTTPPYYQLLHVHPAHPVTEKTHGGRPRRSSPPEALPPFSLFRVRQVFCFAFSIRFTDWG